MHNAKQNRGMIERLKLLVLQLMFLTALGVGEAVAQTTGTNTVTLVSDNVTNASNVVTPLVIGVSIIFIVWRFVKKVASRAG